MSSLSLSPGVRGLVVENRGFASGPCFCMGNDSFTSDQLNVSFEVTNGAWWLGMKGYRIRGGLRFKILAKVKKGKKHDYPWPDDINPDSENGFLKYLSYFKPLPEQPKPVTLPFEKPLVDLEKQIIEALKDLYTHLTPIQRLTIARHPNRPTVLDHILNITEKWVELHGDRAGYDDPAIVTGIGGIDGKSYLFIGHQKGRNTKENIARNFAMPTPHGYRKALRMMKYADHHGFPIVTFIDTPGAFADLKSEELGQGEAIAHNLRTMFGLKVPIVTVVTGEGGSGGAIAIGCANKLFMLENSAFYVASPEACAAILWKSSQAAPKAAEKLRITAQEHYKLKVADGIIPEPLGGAHTDPAWTSQQIKLTILHAMEELEKMNAEELLRHRMLKFRSIGGFKEGVPVDPVRKRNMKPPDIDNSLKFSDIDSEIKSLKRKILEAKGPSDPISNKAIEKLKQDVDQEITNAFIAMGLQEQLKALKMELSKVSAPNQPLNSRSKEKVDRLFQEFNRHLSRPGAYMSLKQKLQKLDMVNQLLEQKAKGEKLKTELNQKIQGKLKEKLEILKKTDEKLEKANQLDGNLVTEIERMKEELKEVLKSANLEIVGVSKRTAATAVELEEKIAMKANEEITKEIERAVDVAGLRSKLEKLKEEITKGSSPERKKKMEEEIREGIVAAMDVTMLNKKFENLRMELASKNETPVGDNMGANSSQS